MSLNNVTAAAVNALTQDLNARTNQTAANISSIQRQTTITNNMLASQQHNDNIINNNNQTTNIESITTNNNNNLFNLIQVKKNFFLKL